MITTVNLLGALTTLLCAFLLWKRYWHVRVRLLLWSSLCFAGLTVSNALAFIDLALMPQNDIYLLRLATAAVSMSVLLCGLIWDSE
jgi:hypothetical protein